MAKICLCLTAKTLKRNLEILDKYRKNADIVELRVDCLDPDERFLIRRFPEQAGLPAILTIRRIGDGGYFNGGEGTRVSLMARGLAYAEANRRLNFAYVDIEEDLNIPSLEEAARTFGTRIIRSWHSLDGNTGNISAKIRDMKCLGDDLVKIAVKANSPSDVLNLLLASREYQKKEKIFLCMGTYGVYSRILAEQFGSYLSYSCAPSEDGIVKGADNQMDIKELAELYRFRSINKSTKIYGMVGNPPLAQENMRFFNSVFGLEEIDAVYVPFPVNSLAGFMKLAHELDVAGLSVSGPYKEEIVPFLYQDSQQVELSGSCDTVYRNGIFWAGVNMGIRCFSELLLDFIRDQGFKPPFFKALIKRLKPRVQAPILDLRWMKVTLIGAGEMAKVVAAELYRLGMDVLVLDHSVIKARELAVKYKFTWGAVDIKGIEMIEKYRDIIFQTLPAAKEESVSGDARLQGNSGSLDELDIYVFSGKEAVIDLDWKPGRSRFLARAAEAGCRTMNGYELYARQAQYQYAQFMGKDFAPQLFTRVQFGRS